MPFWSKTIIEPPLFFHGSFYSSAYFKGTLKFWDQYVRDLIDIKYLQLYFYHRPKTAAIFHIAKHASENELEGTVVDVEHGLDKHLTERNDASCDENLQTQTRLQKRCNKLNSGYTNNTLKNVDKPKTWKAISRAKRSK